MFGKDFYYGASLSGFQFEMGINTREKDCNTDWYVWTKNKDNIVNGIVSGYDPEIGAGYWDNYGEFHKFAKDCGMNMLRIGIEWSRIFPNPTFGIQQVDLKGFADIKAVEKYREIMCDIKDNGLSLMVNLSHFTLPLWIHDPIEVNRKSDFTKGGWPEDRTVEEFVKFAAFCVECFDDIVDYWSTMNEPNVIMNLGYYQRNSGFPPSIIAPEKMIRGLENTIKAHNNAYDRMKELTGKPVGIIYASPWMTGSNQAVERALHDETWSYLDKVCDKMDFIGLNYYSRLVVEETENGWTVVPGFGQGGIPNSFTEGNRQTSDFGWEIYPEGLYNIAKAICERYRKPFFVTENGIADSEDRYRPYYLVSHMKAIEMLVDEGYPVKGYLHWSLADNYEWAAGFNKLFGLIKLDFKTGNLIPRPSYYIFRQITRDASVKRFDDYLKNPHEIWDKDKLI